MPPHIYQGKDLGLVGKPRRRSLVRKLFLVKHDLKESWGIPGDPFSTAPVMRIF